MGDEALNQEGQEPKGGTAPVQPGRDGDLVSTIDVAERAKAAQAAEPEKPETAEDLEKGKKTEEPPVKEEGDKGKKATPPVEPVKEPPAPEKGPVPYERFAQVIQERNTDRKALSETREELAELRGRVETLQARQPEGEKKPLDYTNILSMSDEEIKDQLEENPKGFAANLLRQAKAELAEEFGGKILSEDRVKGLAKDAFTETDTNQKIEVAYQKFAEANPGFDDMWVSGELKTFCDDHPEHTPISAFLHLSKEKEAKTLDEKIAEAVEAKKEEIEQQVREEMKVKGGARVLGAGPAAAPKREGTDDRLKDSKKYGGDISVLVQRSDEREAASGG